MRTILSLVATWLLAVPFIIFGLNKFLNFASVAPPEGAVAQAFLGAMFGSYLVKIVGTVEIVAGLLILWKRTFYLGLVFIAPVVMNIFFFHIAHDFIGNGIWLLSCTLFVVVVILHFTSIKTIFLSLFEQR